MFNFIPFLIQLVIGVALQVIGFLLMPKVAESQPEEMREMDDPTAEEGRAIPVIFGEVEVTDVNVVFFGEKTTTTRRVSV